MRVFAFESSDVTFGPIPYIGILGHPHVGREGNRTRNDVERHNLTFARESVKHLFLVCCGDTLQLSSPESEPLSQP